MDQIEEFLYLSYVEQITKGRRKLQEAQIGRVLTLLCDSIEECWEVPGIEYLHIHMHDYCTENIFLNHILEHSLAFIEDSVAKGINIVVHCECGISRSSTIVIAYLMKKHKWSVEKALEFVKERRNIVKPNAGFMRQLKLFEEIGYRCDYYELRESKAFKQVEASSNLFKKKVRMSTDGHYTLNESSKNSFEKRYSCKKCRTKLFFDFNVLNHPFGGEKDIINYEESDNNNKLCGQSENCDFVYLLTPMEWMFLNDFSGKITCPGCGIKLGHYTWNGKECLNTNINNGTRCGAYITPWIHLQSTKIDAFALKK